MVVFAAYFCQSTPLVNVLLMRSLSCCCPHLFGVINIFERRYCMKSKMVCSGVIGTHQTLVILVSLVVLSGCAVTGEPFVDYPPVVSGKGQLIIFEIERPDAKLQTIAPVLCNDQFCSRLLNYRVKGMGGSYNVLDFPPGPVKIKTPGDMTWALGPNVVMLSNEITVNIASGKRVVVAAQLVEGRERYWGNTLSSASHTYYFQELPEAVALPRLKGIKRIALPEKAGSDTTTSREIR